MTDFSGMSFNCNGIGNKVKRQKIFTYINDKIKKGFCFLQETHSTPNDEGKWRKQWKGEIFFSHGTSNSTGVAILFSKNSPFKVLKESKDTSGRILILETAIGDEKFLLINCYNANTEKDPLDVLNPLMSMLDGHDVDGDCKTILGGDFNLIFDTNLDCSGGNPSLKKHSIALLIKILDRLNLCDIFRVRFPQLKRFTFHRRNPRIQRRLDYLFTSNDIQEAVDSVDVLPSFMSDHSPVLISVNLCPKINRGKYGWKFNNSLLMDDSFKTGMRNHFETVMHDLNGYKNPHLKWEFFKYQARKYSIAFSIEKTKAETLAKNTDESIVNRYEQADNPPSDEEYAESQAFLESYYSKKTQGSILRSKSLIYDQNEKSSKYFLNLEKRIGENSTLKKVVKGNSELTDSKSILNELHDFYSDLFNRKITKTSTDCNTFLDSLDIPRISNEHKLSCDKALSIEELDDCIFSMSKGKSPGNDGLTVEFYQFFWTDIKELLFESLKYSRIVGELSPSQRQAIIKLIEKRDKDKRFIQNWRPISLLNVDTKLISKCFASRLIPVLPTIIAPDQTAYVKGRFIGEGIRLVSDVLEISKKYNVPGYLLTVDLEKAFDSIDHTFLKACLIRFGFGDNFLAWVSILLNKNESCVSNGGHTTKYFQLRRGARQGDPIAAYFFIMVLEIFFIMVRSDVNIMKLEILDFVFLLTAYADDTTFLVADLDSIKLIFVNFDKFAIFSGMKINQSKCELAGIGVKRSVQTALCGIKNILFCKESVKILGVHFTYCEKLFSDKNFMDCIKKIQNVIRVWSLRFLSLYGKIVSFKSKALSKIISIASLTAIPNEIITIIEKIHSDFIWDNKRPNIKHSTLIGDYDKGGLKDVDIRSKFKSLHLSWVNRLYDDNDHPWKQIPLYFIDNASSSTSVFHPNLNLSTCSNEIPSFYRSIIKYWEEVSHVCPKTPTMVMSESLWYNSYIKIDGKPISPSFCCSNQSIFLYDLFESNGKFISYAEAVLKLNNLNAFKWIQIKNAIPSNWKVLLKDTNVSRENCCLDRHINKNDTTVPIKLLGSKDFYEFFVSRLLDVPTSQKYFNNLFGVILNWDKIYTLPRILTRDSYMQIFQYKLLHNALFLNARLFHLGHSLSAMCSLCDNFSESPVHLFCECAVTRNLWYELSLFLSPHLVLDPLTPQSALVGIFNDCEDNLIKNHILLLFKFCIYKNRCKTLNKYVVINRLKSNFNIEKHLSTSSSSNFEKKWRKVIPVLI